MKKISLVRIVSEDSGTFGMIPLQDGFTFMTGELPWRENKPFVSCIPEGTYQLKYLLSKKFGKFNYHIIDVPGRTNIEFHRANYMGDKTKGFKCELEGCIAVGISLGYDSKQQRMLMQSAAALEKFEKYLREDPFELLEIKIVNVFKPMPDTVIAKAS